jgi:hypothetical protein
MIKKYKLSLYHYLKKTNVIPQIKEVESFDNFIYLIDKEKDWIESLYSMKSQINYLIDNNGEVVVDYIGKFENLEEDFKKAKKAAKTDMIWNAWPEKMRYKTIARRVSDKIDLDPEKVNAQSMIHEETGGVESEANREITENANSQTIDIDIEAEEEDPEVLNEPEKETEPEPDPTEEKEGNEKQQLDMKGTDGPGF